MDVQEGAKGESRSLITLNVRVDACRSPQVLGGGQGEEGDSWYASLGGKSRHDTFTGAVRLDDSVGALPSQYWITAVQAVDSDISREFFVRNTARANLGD